MKDFVIFGLAFFGCIGFCLDYWWIEELVSYGLIDSSVDLWVHLAVMYALLLIAPFTAFNGGSGDVAESIVSAVGVTILDVAKWISIGILVAVGIYIFNTLTVWS